MAMFLWTKERTGELWDGRDKREGGSTATNVPSGHPPRRHEGRLPPLFGARLRRDPPLTQR